MRRILLIVTTATLLINCKKEQNIDVEYVADKFDEYADRIEKIEYNIQRIDTFPQGGIVWNHSGVALIEKDETDELFGFSFYGKRNDVPNEYIYDKGIGFKISKSSKTYETEKGNYGFIGSPGGQMIAQNIFHLDSVYKSRKMIENEKAFILKYEFEDDTVYNVSDIVKTIELTKSTFFPVKVTRTSKALGHRSFNQTIISDVKINDQVQSSIKAYKTEFVAYDIIQPETTEPNRLLATKIPAISLPDLLNQSNTVDLTIDKLTLIDFWETWCGPCIASLSKVESLKHKYSSQLQVVGIVSEDSETAIRLIGKKGATFLNLVGNKDLNKEFSIDSWPRYFLVDRNGVIQKEYFGFSEQIEKDIREYIQ